MDTKILDLFSFALKEALSRADPVKFAELKRFVSQNKSPPELSFISNMAHVIKTDTTWEYEDIYLRRSLLEFTKFVEKYNTHTECKPLAKAILDDKIPVNELIVYIGLCSTHFENIVKYDGLTFVYGIIEPTQEELNNIESRFKQLEILSIMFKAIFKTTEYAKYIPCIESDAEFARIPNDEITDFICRTSSYFKGYRVYENTWHFSNILATKIVKMGFEYLRQFVRRRNFGHNVGFLATLTELMKPRDHYKDMMMIIIISEYYKKVIGPNKYYSN